MRGKILITGGTGTLGHAIMTYAENQSWDCEFTVYARSELRLAKTQKRFKHIRGIVGDVRDIDRLSLAVHGHDIVIHAAAMKRIPECQENPRECYLTNVIGSENVARACLGVVNHVIGISTDKACQAITTYGASKLMMESIFLSYDSIDWTRFSVVRYGNVVASNGSVIPIWEDQYARGNRLDITDMDMTRFWMSPFDAVRAIEVSYNNHGMVYVPKVAACSMVDLARSMFNNCKFNEIGLRSNEKIHEDLVSKHELSTDVGDSILIGRGGSGLSYSSDSARALDPIDFTRMMAEATEIEH